MNRPTFLEGAGVAFVASILGSGAFVLLAAALDDALALRAVVAAAGLGYLLYLLVRSRARVGRVCMLALWALATGVTAVLDPPLAVHVLAQLAVAWLTRAWWLHAGVLPALADLGLAAASLAAAAWAMHQTGSLALAIWCLLLVQAAFVVIPPSLGAGNDDPSRAPPSDDPFQRARQTAEWALRRLSTAR